MSEITFTIPEGIWLNSNQRLHFRPKAQRTAALRLMAKVESFWVKPVGVVHVAAFIGFQTNGKADASNAHPTVKALIDGMTDAGVWEDDDSTHVIGPTYLRGPKSPTPGHYTVRLVLTPQDIPWIDKETTP